MIKGIKSIIKGLLEGEICKVILKEDFPAEANALPGRFVLSNKSSEENKIKFKERFVIGSSWVKVKTLWCNCLKLYNHLLSDRFFY